MPAGLFKEKNKINKREWGRQNHRTFPAPTKLRSGVDRRAEGPNQAGEDGAEDGHGEDAGEAVLAHAGDSETALFGEADLPREERFHEPDDAAFGFNQRGDAA